MIMAKFNNKLFYLLFIVLISTGFGQDSSKPVISVLPLDYEIQLDADGMLTITEISDVIRGEVTVNDKVLLVDRDTELKSINTEEFRYGVKSDSVIQKIAATNGASHVIIWSIRETFSKYKVDMKHYNVQNTGDDQFSAKAKWLTGMVRYRFSSKHTYDELKLNLQKATWVVMGTTPPKDRFPAVSFLMKIWTRIKAMIDSFFYWLEMSYGIGYVIALLVLISALGGYGIFSIFRGEGDQTSGIGFPPDYPEGQ